LHQVFGQKHVVVTEEDSMGTRVGAPDEMRPFLDQNLSRLIRGMRLAGEDELDRAL
jgi:hypothetical protein